MGTDGRVQGWWVANRPSSIALSLLSESTEEGQRARGGSANAVDRKEVSYVKQHTNYQSLLLVILEGYRPTNILGLQVCF
jgi:hypothetical protein